MVKEALQTNVDKLVTLVRERKSVTFKEAAKTLAVPLSTIEEWAEILEESHVLSIVYKLNTPHLVMHELSAAQKTEKVSAFEKDKEAISKKLEAASSYFYELDKKIEAVHRIFADIGGDLDGKMRKVHDDIASLMAAEARKQQLDQQVLDAKTRATQKLHEVEEHIAQLKKSYSVEYESSKHELEDDLQKLMQSQKYLDRVKEQESLLQKKLDEIRIVSQTIAKEANDRAKMISSTQDHMRSLKEKHDKLKAELEKEHQNLNKMILLNEEQENHLKQTQKDLFARIEENEKSLAKKQLEIKTIPQKFKELIEHRSEIHDIISQISSREVELKAEVERLQKEARLLSVSMNPAEIQLELDKLHKKLSDVASMRSFFKEKIVRLTQLLDLKGVL